jgi:hypothetical protein
MNFSPADISTMRQALTDLRSQIEETGPCDHPVNICICGLRTTYENLGSLFYRITDKRVGFAPTPELIDLEQMTRNILGIKSDADAANTAFRKGTIND